MSKGKIIAVLVVAVVIAVWLVSGALEALNRPPNPTAKQAFVVAAHYALAEMPDAELREMCSVGGSISGDISLGRAPYWELRFWSQDGGSMSLDADEDSVRLDGEWIEVKEPSEVWEQAWGWVESAEVAGDAFARAKEDLGEDPRMGRITLDFDHGTGLFMWEIDFWKGLNGGKYTWGYQYVYDAVSGSFIEKIPTSISKIDL